MAGAKYEPETNIFAAKRLMASQKLPQKHAMAQSGIDNIFPIMITLDFVMYDLFSNLSEIIPPIIELEIPKTVRATALRIAYSLLKAGKDFWKNTGKNAVTTTEAIDLIKPAAKMFAQTGFLLKSFI